MEKVRCELCPLQDFCQERKQAKEVYATACPLLDGRRLCQARDIDEAIAVCQEASQQIAGNR